MKNYSYSELFHKITRTNHSQEDDPFTRFSIYDDERNCLITGDVLRVSITSHLPTQVVRTIGKSDGIAVRAGRIEKEIVIVTNNRHI